MSSFVEHLEWRHATKGFDNSKIVSEADLGKILHAIRMAPTSFGLQPFHVEVIANPEIKANLFAHSWNQKQVVSCSHLLVFVSHTDVESRIGQYFTEMTGGNADVRAGLKDYENMMHAQFKDRTEEDRKTWATKQVYIALGFALAACAELKIDSCPMEGIVASEYDKLLGISKGQYCSVALPIGYRDPAIPPRPKFRFAEKELFKKR